MTANVEIITGTKANVLRVPTGALRFRPKVADRGEPAKDKAVSPGKKQLPLPTLYLAGAELYRPTKKQVRIGLQGDEYTEVTSGIKAGDKGTGPHQIAETQGRDRRRGRR